MQIISNVTNGNTSQNRVGDCPQNVRTDYETSTYPNIIQLSKLLY